MKKFITKVIKFIILPVFCLALFFKYFGVLPVLYSNNISLNAKLNDIKLNHPKSNLDVLSIGSSLSLNNLNSQAIVNEYGSKYLNISSWGQSLEHSFKLMKLFVPYFKPKIIIISGNYIDFNSNKMNIKYDLIKKHLSKGFPPNNFTIRNPLKKTSRIFYIYTMAKENDYENLNFDEYGGVNLNGDNFNIIQKRWKGDEFNKRKIHLKQYKFLDSIAEYCNRGAIKLIYAQSPLRQGYLAKNKSRKKEFIKNHAVMIDSILKNKNAFFVKTLNETWPDSLFVDYLHLNNKGSKVYTDFILEQSNIAFN